MPMTVQELADQVARRRFITWPNVVLHDEGTLFFGQADQAQSDAEVDHLRVRLAELNLVEVSTAISIAGVNGRVWALLAVPTVECESKQGKAFHRERALDLVWDCCRAAGRSLAGMAQNVPPELQQQAAEADAQVEAWARETSEVLDRFEQFLNEEPPFSFPNRE